MTSLPLHVTRCLSRPRDGHTTLRPLVSQPIGNIFACFSMTRSAGREEDPRERWVRVHRIRLRVQEGRGHEEPAPHTHHSHQRTDAAQACEPRRRLQAQEVLLHRPCVQKRGHGRHSSVRIPPGTEEKRTEQIRSDQTGSVLEGHVTRVHTPSVTTTTTVHSHTLSPVLGAMQGFLLLSSFLRCAFPPSLFPSCPSQVEGLVADYNLTLGNLIGIIRTFFEKIGRRLMSLVDSN